MNWRENWLRMIEFREPEWIPCTISYISPPYWRQYDRELRDLVEQYPRIFPAGMFTVPRRDKPEIAEAEPDDYTWRDDWGVLWRRTVSGVGGQCMESPLADWAALKTYEVPDPLADTEMWKAEEKRINEQKRMGYLVRGAGAYDLFTHLMRIRGYENMMMDFASDDPHIYRLIEMITDRHMKGIRKTLELGADYIFFHNDLGWQTALAISPDMFRRFIKPAFKRMFGACRDAGVHAHLSSDGYILEIADDLAECGVSCCDPQIAGNTIDGIKSHFKGKMAVQLRLDAQRVPFADKEEIRRMVQEAVEKLSDRRGGLWLNVILCTEDVPIATVAQVCEVFQELSIS
jgi:uroporphyrinogen decarboxylase